MSHNKLKIASQEPNRTSEISLAITNLSDIGSTPNNGDYLQYDSTASEWTPISSATNIAVFFAGAGASQAYSTSPASAMTAGSQLYIYDTSPTNNIPSATVTSTSGWIESITLPAGTYVLKMQLTATFTASGYIAYAFYNGATLVSAIGVDGDNRSTYQPSNPLAIGYVSPTSDTTYTMKIIGASNVDTVANQANTIAEHGLLIVEKVG